MLVRLRKVGRVWCGVARKTHLATCHNGVTPSKTKEFLKSPCFFRSRWQKNNAFSVHDGENLITKRALS